jgi:hypothetical protein
MSVANLCEFWIFPFLEGAFSRSRRVFLFDYLLLEDYCFCTIHEPHLNFVITNLYSIKLLFSFLLITFFYRYYAKNIYITKIKFAKVDHLKLKLIKNQQ